MQIFTQYCHDETVSFDHNQEGLKTIFKDIYKKQS